MIDANDITLDGVLWYKAPTTYVVTPKEIEPGLEYLELIVGGTVYFEVNGERRKLGYGTLFWHLPREFTICETERDDPYQCIVIKFRRSHPIHREFPRVSVLEDREGACEFGKSVLASFHNDKCDRDLLGIHLYSWLAWHVHQSVLTVPDSELPAPLASLVEAVNDDPSQHLTVADMSRIAGISQPHLHALFRDHLGTTPHKYLLSRRLNLARRLIVGTDDPIKSVSAQCGFENVETFYRCFNKRFSMSPGAFRRKNRPNY